MKFKIPANTELEDKILPFLTVRQLIILSIWWAICYGIFNILFWLWYVPAVWWTIDFVVWSLFVASAFLKINHLEFHRWIMLLISKLFIPQRRFFNNWLIWWQYFDVLNITWSNNDQSKNNKKISKLKKIKEEEKKNNLDEMKNQIFWNNEKNFNNLEKDSDIDLEEKEEFSKRFW